MLDGRHRRLLHGQRPAPGEPQRPGRRPHRRARARDRARTRCSPTPTRSCSSTSRRRRSSQRLREGKVYPAARVARRAQRLLPDREPPGAARGRAAAGGRGRRGQAARARAARGARGAPVRLGRPQADRRAAAGAGHARQAVERVMRRAWRSAQRLGAELDILVVRATRTTQPSAGEREQLEALRRLASRARRPAPRRGGRRGRRRSRGGSRASAARRTSCWGRRAPRAGWAGSREPLAMQLVRLLPDVDVRLVSSGRRDSERRLDM